LVAFEFTSERTTITDQPLHHLTYGEIKLIIESLEEDVRTQVEYNSSRILEDMIIAADDQVHSESMTTQ
jgi:hypothetical protein